jgi:hypothetical protein
MGPASPVVEQKENFVATPFREPIINSNNETVLQDTPGENQSAPMKEEIHHVPKLRKLVTMAPSDLHCRQD